MVKTGTTDINKLKANDLQISKMTTESNTGNALMIHQMSLAKITLKYKAGVVTTKNYTWNTSTNTANITNSGTTNLMASNVFSTSTPYVTPYYYNTESNQEIYYFIAKYNEKPQVVDDDNVEYKKWTSVLTIQNNSSNALGKNNYQEFTVSSRGSNRGWDNFTANLSYPTTSHCEGEVVTFTIPQTGIYKLEAWGASGGGVSYFVDGQGYGAPGGYAYGNIRLTAGQNLYVCIGGAGKYVWVGNTGEDCNKGAGFNGGGQGGIAKRIYDHGFGGGGATHIATVKHGTGVLTEYENHQDDILVVAGGGGGSDDAQSTTGNDGRGGVGGGDVGGNAETSGTGVWEGSGGASDTDNYTYAFGKGQDSTAENDNGGGGGGWYGGIISNGSSGGGGGSGHINTDKMIAGSYGMSSGIESPVKYWANDLYAISSGTIERQTSYAGYARITFISE